MTNEQRSALKQKRKARLLKLITMDPPTPLPNILKMEGMSERAVREIIRELEAEHGLDYTSTAGAKKGNCADFGLSEATSRFRSRLGRELYRLTNSENEYGFNGRLEIQPVIGMNPRAQLRAESAPFGHDWTLSQIERLAQQLGENPREFMLKCLTT